MAGGEDFESIGFSELLEQNGVVVVEWASRVEKILPVLRIRVRIEVTGKSDRRINDWGWERTSRLKIGWPVVGSHFCQGGLFDLADALLGEAHLRADLLVGRGAAFGEAVVRGDHIAFAAFQAGH